VRPRCRVLVPTLLLLGCVMGTTTNKYQPAQGPAGAEIHLTLAEGRTVTGELLSIDSGVLLVLERSQVLERGQLLRVSVGALRDLRAPKVNYHGSDLPAATRERLRLISRYPQGVSPELERQLLQAYGQEAVVEVP